MKTIVCLMMGIATLVAAGTDGELLTKDWTVPLGIPLNAANLPWRVTVEAK